MGIKGWFARNLASNLLLVILLLVIAGIPIYRSMHGMILRQAVSDADSALASMVETVDELCQEMDRVAYLSQSNGNMLPYFMQSDAYYALQAHMELARIALTGGMYSEVALAYAPDYFTGESKIYASSGQQSARQFFEYSYRYDQWDRQALYTELCNYTSSTMRPLEWVLVRRSSRTRYMTYIAPLSKTNVNRRGVMLFLIPEPSMSALVRRFNLMDGATLMLFDSEGNAVYSQGDAQTSAEEIADHPNGRQEIEFNGRSYTLLSVQSGYNAWRYALLIPSSDIAAFAYDGTQPILIYLFIGLVCATALSTLLTIRNAQPVKRLQSVALRVRPDANANPGDAFDLIERAITGLQKDNTDLSGRLHSQRSTVRMHLMQRLYYGKSDQLDSLIALLAEEGIFFHQNRFRVLVFRIDDAALFEQRLDPSMRELVRFGLIRVLEGLAHSCALVGIGCDFGRGDQTALLLGDGALEDGDISSLAERAQELSMAHFKFTMTVGVSAPFDQLEAINEAYMSALEAAERRFIIGCGHTIFAGEPNEPESDMTSSLRCVETRLISHLHREEMEPVADALREYVSTLVGSCTSPARARQHLSMLVLAMRQAVRQMPIRQEDLTSRFDDLMVMRHETVQGALESLLELTARIADALGAVRKAQTSRQIGDIMRYMDANLANPAINNDRIAQVFSISIGHLSRLFREHTGTSPMQYLDSMRMGRACALLKDTPLNIADILAACGYVDKTNFIRKFKKVHQMTPMEYRRAAQVSAPSNR